MLSLIVLAAVQCAAAPQIATLEAPDAIWDLAAKDLNQNGHKDIVALCGDPKSDPLRKYLAVFMSTGTGTYPSVPTFMMALDPGAGGLFWAETDGQPPRELVVTTPRGADVYAYREEGFERIRTIEFPSLLPGNVREPQFLDAIARDLNNDGIDEWLIPTHTGYIIRTADREYGIVECDIVSEVRGGSSVQIRHRLPAPHLFSLEEQSPKGIAFLGEESVDFAYGEKWTQHTRYKLPINDDNEWDVSAQLKDINRNGLPDLIVTQTKGNVNITVVTQVYIATAPFTYPDEPTAEFEAKGAFATPLLIDVDGDEQLDVMFIKVPFGVRNFMNLFLRRKVAIDVDVFLFDGQTFSTRPDFSTSVTLDAPEGRERPAFILADFDGDGRLDAMFGSGTDEVVIHTGEPERFISSRPWVTLPFKPFGEARTYDLNGNGAQDLVMFRPGGRQASKIDIAVF